MRISSYISRVDLRLGGLIFLGSLVGWLWLRAQPKGQTCAVVKGDEVVGRLDLSRDTSLLIEGPIGRTRLVVIGGEVQIAEAPCPDQLCRRMGRISRSGEALICLPNRVLLYIEGDGDLDAITR